MKWCRFAALALVLLMAALMLPQRADVAALDQEVSALGADVSVMQTAGPMTLDFAMLPIMQVPERRYERGSQAARSAPDATSSDATRFQAQTPHNSGGYDVLKMPAGRGT